MVDKKQIIKNALSEKDGLDVDEIKKIIRKEENEDMRSKEISNICRYSDDIVKIDKKRIDYGQRSLSVWGLVKK